MDLKRYKEAIQMFDQAILLDPLKADYFNNKGVLFNFNKQEMFWWNYRDMKKQSKCMIIPFY